MKIAHMATRRVLTVRPDDSLDKAICLMEEHDIHHLPVVATGGIIEGILSDRDLLIAVGWKLSADRRFSGRSTGLAGPRIVRDVMTHPAICASPSEPLHVIARIMTEHRIGAVILTREGRLTGIVTKFDLLDKAREWLDAAPALAVLRESVQLHMRAHVFTAHLQDPIHNVAALMHDKNLRHVPVVADDTLLGIVTDRDIRRACGVEQIEDEQAEEAGRLYLGPTKILAIMSSNVRTISPDATLLEAAEDMAAHRIGALPVERDQKMIGILTDTDVIRVLSQIEE